MTAFACDVKWTTLVKETVGISFLYGAQHRHGHAIEIADQQPPCLRVFVDQCLDQGVQFVSNRGFESWTAGAPDGWVPALQAGNVLESTTVVRSGSSSVQLEGTSGGILRVHQQFTGLQPETAYLVSFWEIGMPSKRDGVS